MKKKVTVMSIAGKLPTDLYEKFSLALNHYHIPTAASFITMAANALVDAHEMGESVPLPLRFVAVQQERKATK